MLKRFATFLGRNDGSLQRRALRSGAWVGLSSVGIAGLTFARGIILARLLTPEIFGLMAASLMATRLIEIFTETGFGAALIHRQEKFEEARDTAFTMAVFRGLILSGLSLLIAPLVASFYGRPALAPIVAVAGTSFILMGWQNINLVALQKELDFKRLTLIELLGSVLGFVVSIGLAYWLRDVWALVYAQIASAGITAALSFIMAPGRVRFRFDFAIAKELYQYGRFITGLAIVVFFTRELDSAVIGRLLGIEALGFYVAAYSLANLPSTYLSKLVAKVMFPLFSKLQNDPEALRKEYGRGIRLITSIVVPVSVATAVLAPEIVGALYGARWAPAIAPLQILSAFGCFRALWIINGYLYNAIGKPRIDFYLSLSRLVLMSALLWPLTRRFGMVGASVAVAIPMALQFIVGVYLSQRLIGVTSDTAIRPLMIASAQGAILAAVLLASKLAVTAHPRVDLLVLLVVAGSVSAALNLRDLRLLAANGLR